MIQLTKQQLNFLTIYLLWMDKEQAFRLKGEKDKNKIIFTQESQKGFLISTIDYNIPENFDFDFNFDTYTFVSLVRSLSDETLITITQKGIEFNENKYDIKNYKMQFTDFNPYLNDINKDNPEFEINDIEKFKYIKDSIGMDDLAVVAFQNKYFITSDRMNYSSFVKTTFDYTDPFFFASDLFNLLTTIGEKNKRINLQEKYYYVWIGNTVVFFMNKDYSIPNMFDPDIMKMYDFKDKFEVDKNKFKIILDRMKIVASANRDSRIAIELQENEVIIKNNDNQLAYEKLEAIVDKDVIGLTFNISSVYLSQVLNYLEGEKIFCYCSNNKDDFATLKVSGVSGDNFYVINLLED